MEHRGPEDSRAELAAGEGGGELREAGLGVGATAGAMAGGAARVATEARPEDKWARTVWVAARTRRSQEPLERVGGGKVCLVGEAARLDAPGSWVGRVWSSEAQETVGRARG